MLVNIEEEKRPVLCELTNCRSESGANKTSIIPRTPPPEPLRASALSSEEDDSSMFSHSIKVLRKYFYLKNFTLPATPNKNDRGSSFSSRFRNDAVVQERAGNDSLSFTGYPPYLSQPNSEGTDVTYDVLLPLDTLPDGNTEYDTLKGSSLRDFNTEKADKQSTNELSLGEFETMELTASLTMMQNSTPEVDSNEVSSLSTEDVILEFGYPIIVQGPLKYAKGTTTGHVILQSQILLVTHERLLRDIVREHREYLRVLSLGEGSRPGIMAEKAYQWIFTNVTNDETASCESVHQSLDEMLTYHFEVTFQSYCSKVLELSFMYLYRKMVAIPMIQWMEYYSRRVVCMQRDINMHDMAELFLLTFYRKQSLRGSVPVSPAKRSWTHFSRKKTPARAPPPPGPNSSVRPHRKLKVASHTLRNANGSRDPKNILRSNSGSGGGETRREWNSARSRARADDRCRRSSKSPVVRPLQSHMVLLPGEPKPGSPRTPRDTDLMDVLSVFPKC